MKNKNLLLISILLFSIFVSIAFVSSTTTVSIVSPSASSSIAGTIIVNTTITGYGFNPNTADSFVNITLYAKSSLTGNSSWTVVATNLSVNLTLTNSTYTTFNTNILEDANNYVLNATYVNATNGKILGDDTNTGITIDNTKPTAPSGITPAESSVISTAGDQTFSSTVVNRETTSCTYTIARGGATSGNDYFSGDGTYSASTCSFTKAFSTSADNGNWYVTFTASDETNTTGSTTRIVNVGFPGSGGGLPSEVISNPILSKNNNLLFMVIGILAIIIVLVIWISVKKK